jgi:hypothetical protein
MSIESLEIFYKCRKLLCEFSDLHFYISAWNEVCSGPKVS